MSEDRQKLFHEVVQVLSKVMIPQNVGGQATCGHAMEASMGASLGANKMKAMPEQPYGPVVIEQLDQLRQRLYGAEETLERLYEKTKMVTYPEPANQVLTGGVEVEQVIPPVAEEIRDACRRVDCLIGRMQYLIGRIGL